MKNPEEQKPVVSPADTLAVDLLRRMDDALVSAKTRGDELNERFLAANDRATKLFGPIRDDMDEVVHDIMVIKAEKPPADNDK